MAEEKEINLEDVKNKLEECQKQKDEYLAGWQRARADFLNYKKDESERVQEILKFANVEFVFKILPIIDNLELAEKEVKNNKENKIADVVKGFLQIKIQLQEFLKNQGIEEIETENKKFDPNFHDAVEAVEKKGFESGLVVEEIQKGYMIDGKTIRPAKVKVAK